MARRPDLLTTLTTFIQQAPSRSFCVALSGGLDSTALLHALHQLSSSHAISLRAIHVHHGLSRFADEWQLHCENLCQSLAVPLHSEQVEVAAAGQSLEATARAARYAVFERQLKAEECLVVAHHQDDQAETFLLQALRGAGPQGLAAMPLQKRFAAGWMCRPMLTHARLELEAYAYAEGLIWVEDDSNQNQRFDRNFLRQQVMPLLQSRWPAAAEILSRAARHCTQASELMQEVAEKDLQQCLRSNNSLSISELKSISKARLENMLRYWISLQALALPNSAKLYELCRQLQHYQTGHQLLIDWQQVEVRAYQARLYAMPKLPPVTLEPFDWHGEVITLPAPFGLLTKASVQLPTDITWPLQVKTRQAGQRVQLPGRSHRHSLKKLMQLIGVPPWLRDRIPLIFHENILVAIPGFTL